MAQEFLCISFESNDVKKMIRSSTMESVFCVKDNYGPCLCVPSCIQCNVMNNRGREKTISHSMFILTTIRQRS